MPKFDLSSDSGTVVAASMSHGRSVEEVVGVGGALFRATSKSGRVVGLQSGGAPKTSSMPMPMPMPMFDLSSGSGPVVAVAVRPGETVVGLAGTTSPTFRARSGSGRVVGVECKK